MAIGDQLNNLRSDSEPLFALVSALWMPLVQMSVLLWMRRTLTAIHEPVSKRYAKLSWALTLTLALFGWAPFFADAYILVYEWVLDSSVNSASLASSVAAWPRLSFAIVFWTVLFATLEPMLQRVLPDTNSVTANIAVGINRATLYTTVYVFSSLRWSLGRSLMTTFMLIAVDLLLSNQILTEFKRLAKSLVEASAQWLLAMWRRVWPWVLRVVTGAHRILLRIRGRIHDLIRPASEWLDQKTADLKERGSDSKKAMATEATMHEEYVILTLALRNSNAKGDAARKILDKFGTLSAAAMGTQGEYEAVFGDDGNIAAQVRQQVGDAQATPEGTELDTTLTGKSTAKPKSKPLRAIMLMVALLGAVIVAVFVFSDAGGLLDGFSASAPGATSPDQQSSATSAPQLSVMASRSGTGTEVSSRFELSGDYTLRLVAKSDCYYSFDLVNAKTGQLLNSLGILTEAGSASTEVRYVPDAKYRISAITRPSTGCPWTVAALR